MIWKACSVGVLGAVFVAMPAFGAPVFTENFNDNSIDAMRWCVYQNIPSVLRVQEKNGRLEVSSPSNPAGNAAALVSSCGWAFDTTSNFKWKVDYHFANPGLHSGDFGIVAGCWVEAAPNPGGTPLYDGVAAVLGSDISGTYSGTGEVSAGVIAEDDFESPAPELDGTVYFSYIASEDTLYVSTVGYNDPDAAEFGGFGATSDSMTAGVALGGFSRGPAVGFSGSGAWFDNLVVNAGSTLNPCPADLDNSGDVNFDDLDAFVAGFLGGDFVADCTGDGRLNFDDLDCFVDSYLAGCP